MNNEIKLNIAGIKSLKNKAKTWIYEWLIAYAFFASLLILLSFCIQPNYFLTLGVMFFVLTALTINLISIERIRIKDCDEILNDLKEDENKHSNKLQDDLNILLSELEFIQEQLSYFEHTEYNNRETSYIVRRLLDMIKTIIKDNYNAQ